MKWQVTNRADPRAASLADRHYSRQKPGSVQFTPPGRVLVLLTPACDAVWATSWPFAEYVHREWKTAWVCSLFRNESPYLSSELVVQAVAVTRWRYPQVPPEGMITMIDKRYTKSPNPGYCYKKAGFVQVGKTKGGLIVLQQLECDMPAPCPPRIFQETMLGLLAV